jgi:hypothetical protein
MGLLYHMKLGLPPVQLPARMYLQYSRHALRAANEETLGTVRLGRYLETSEAQLVELETGWDRVAVKAVFRVSNDSLTDLIIVVNLQPENSGMYLVRTVWLNGKNDNHATLDTSRYQKRG